MKNCWILFAAEEFKIGSIEGRFSHFPPTATDLRNMKDAIKAKYNISECVILNWKELTEE